MTENRYYKNLEYLLEQSPEHPFRETLERGYSPINVRYLQKGLEELPEPEENSKSASEETVKPGDNILEQLQRDKSNLFVERAKLSNKFHTLDDVDQRIANSKQILIIQNQIKKVNGKTNHYRKHGKLPSTKEKERFPLPDSALGIDRKIKSIRVMISQVKNELKDTPFSEKDTIQNKEARLDYLRNYLDYAENALQEKESAG